MSLLTTAQVDDLRHVLLGECVNAATVALSAEMLLRRVQRSRQLDFEVTVHEASVVLNDLLGRGLVTVVPQKLSDTPYFQATAAGIMAYNGR